jgi:hypothetical protein
MREMNEGRIELCNWRSWIPARAWLLFNTWFSLLVVCASAAATLHVPINKAAWAIVIFCSGLAVALAIGSLKSATNRNSLLGGIAATLLVLATVVVVLWGSLVNGQFVSVYPDTWSYSALGAYLQNPVRVINDGSQPVLSYGSALMGTRYGTASLLALLSAVTETDTCRSANIYAFLVLVQTAFGFTLLARAYGSGPVLSLCAGIYGLAMGWAPEILKIGNWDQFLFLSFIPFIILRVRFATLPPSRWRAILTLGLCLGAGSFSYPEGAALSGVIYLPLLLWRFARGKDPLKKIGKVAAACGIGFLLCLEYLPTFVSFLSRQIAAGDSILPAKGVLGGLLSPAWLPAVYCLGDQLPATVSRTPAKLSLIVPLVFVALTFLALKTWWKKKDGILLTIPIFVLLSLWQVLLLGYDYGFYKVLTMFWPVMVVAIFVGTSQLLALCRGLARRVVIVALCGVLAGALFDEFDHFQYAPWRQERRIQPFLELTKLKEIFGDAPIRIATQSWFNQMWAVFFLRGYKVEIANPLLNLRDPSTGLNHGATEQRGGTLVLTDEKQTSAIWRNEVFCLLNHSEPVEVLTIDAPNGVEIVEGDPFIWLDNQFVDLTIRSDTDCQAFLFIPECRPGPSRPGDRNRTLILKANGETAEVPAEGSLKVPLELKKGKNLVRLECKEPATIDKLSSGDTRTLLLGIKGLSVRAAD